MENWFKFTFFLAILVFCILAVGVFILVIKIILMFNPDVRFWSLIITRA